MILSLAARLLRPLLGCWLRKAAPKRHGTILIPGLEKRVQVFWDPFAIPHLSAANEHDLFLAQGYLHAQERLWQMDLNRRILCGRLAEILGEKPIPWRELSIHFRDRSIADMDYFIRLMGIRRTAAASLSQLPEQYLNPLLAYSEGVNRYMESHVNSLPLEFRLLRYQPELWQPEDCLTIGKGFAFFLSTSLFTRLTWIALADRLKGQEPKLSSLSPNYPTAGASVTRCVEDEAREILRFVNGTFQQGNWTLGSQGSNNWVIAPERSSTGRAILCNDPHLRMTLPSVWYLMHLKIEPNHREEDEFEVWGASIPGSPCIHLGHNRRIAWGVTAALCDDGDLYREKIHPEDPDLYLVGNRWTKLESKEEKIAIRGGKELKKRIRLTRHGPVLSDLAPSKGDLKEELLAFKWTAHEPTEEFRCLYGINRARNWDEFLHSLSYQTAPTLNYVYADSAGNIGYSLAGKVPLRRHAPSFLPLPGWSGEFEWQGHIPFSELPHLYNPAEGMIATANNRIADASYPYYLSELFDPPYRIQRIRELLSAKKKLSVEEMAEIHGDIVSVHAKELIAVLQADLEQIACNDDALKQSADQLLYWDGSCSEKSTVAALFHVFHHCLIKNLLVPDLGLELFLAYTEIFNQSLAPTDQILRNPDSPWFRSCPRRTLVQKSLREAQEELTGRLGTDRDQWHWGRLHTLTLRHPFERVRILSPLFSIGPFPSGGDGVTINMGYYRYSNPYHQIVGASLRMVIDVGAWERSFFILPSGQSGHPFSRHYRDQTGLWQERKYVRLFDIEEESRSGSFLSLIPHT